MLVSHLLLLLLLVMMLLLLMLQLLLLLSLLLLLLLLLLPPLLLLLLHLVLMICLLRKRLSIKECIKHIGTEPKHTHTHTHPHTQPCTATLEPRTANITIGACLSFSMVVFCRSPFQHRLARCCVLAHTSGLALNETSHHTQCRSSHCHRLQYTQRNVSDKHAECQR